MSLYKTKQYEPCCGLSLWHSSPAVGFFIGVTMNYTKQCTKCRGVFPATLEFFHKSKRKKDGLHLQCKSCTNQAQRRRAKQRNKNKPPHRREYSEHEIEFIKSNYGKVSTLEIANALDRKPSAIQQKARTNLGLDGSHGISHRKGTDHISLTYFNKIICCAKKRNIHFDLTIEDITELLVRQDFKCALSGVEIYAGYNSDRTQTASLDRIDSSKGYVIKNVQWLHKDVNIAKMALTQQDFIQLCLAVASVAQSKGGSFHE